MGVQEKLIHALNRTIELAGTQLRIRYFDPTPGSVWDDETALAQSGNNLWTSGIVFPINAREGSTESLLLEQGKLIDSDKRLYVHGSLLFTGSTQLVDIQIGSPTGDLYTTIPDGGIRWEAEGQPVYKKEFIRRVTGSLI